MYLCNCPGIWGDVSCFAVMYVCEERHDVGCAWCLCSFLGGYAEVGPGEVVHVLMFCSASWRFDPGSSSMGMLLFICCR